MTQDGPHYTQDAATPTGPTARRELRETNANLFSAVLDAMTDGVMVVDDKVRLVVTNRALRETLLLPPGSHGQQLSEVLHEAEVVAAFAAVLAGSGPKQLNIQYKGLTERSLDVRVLPLPDHAYWGHRALGIMRDVTEARSVEQLLRDFIANASHELRTPVTAILGYAEVLAEAPPTDAQQLAQFHDTVYRHAQRLDTLLRQLLDLNRLETGNWLLHQEDLQLRTQLVEIADQQRDAAAAAGLSVLVTVPPRLRAWLDPSALAVVVGNLLQNAIKYSKPGGEPVRIVASRADPSQVRISVIDRGIGMAESEQTRMFERFYRVDKGRSRRMGGVGLGLSIVQNLVQTLGGRIEMVSEPGEGSTFSVILPTRRRTV